MIHRVRLGSYATGKSGPEVPRVRCTPWIPRLLGTLHVKVCGNHHSVAWQTNLNQFHGAGGGNTIHDMHTKQEHSGTRSTFAHSQFPSNTRAAEVDKSTTPEADQKAHRAFLHVANVPRPVCQILLGHHAKVGALLLRRRGVALELLSRTPGAGLAGHMRPCWKQLHTRRGQGF